MTAESRLRETRLDLMIGCVLHSMIFEGIGLAFVRNRLPFSLGIFLGTIIALGCCHSMYRGILHCSGMDPVSARRRMTLYSILRAGAMFAGCGAGFLTGRISFFGVLTGLMGLKVAAYLHVYTNVYITRRFFRKYI